MCFFYCPPKRTHPCEHIVDFIVLECYNIPMEHLNYFDYISFPDRKERDKIRQSYFDTHNLRISELDFKNLSEKHSIATLKEFDKYAELNSKILNFNNTVVYLDLAILKMVNYYDLLVTNQNKDEITMYETLYRQSCRNVSCEIYIYEEKIKDFLRYIFDLNIEKTKSDTKFIVELKKACEKITNGNNFLLATNTYHTNENVIAIKKLRNDEVHNTSYLLTDYKAKNLTYDNELYLKIKHCLQAMLELKNSLYNFFVEYFGL